jgi:beta-1,4-mannosyl-glycoprotein beta-1,4-N-acetylglucosaminyltransferase
MNKIIDCFTFYNELKMLSFRLEELNDYVDYFVLAEATVTHAGQEKELFYQNNKDLFEKYNHKIIHVIVDDMPLDNPDNWSREIYQRNCLVKGIERLDVKDTDIILISDCDEIPNTELLEQMKIHGCNIFNDENNLEKFAPPEYGKDFGYDEYEKEIIGFVQDMFFYNLECKNNGVWYMARAMTYKKLKEIESANMARRYYTPVYGYMNAGWHFSYFLGIDTIINKIQNFAHQEFNNQEYLIKEKIEDYIRNNKDLYGRETVTFTHIPIESNTKLPKNYKMLL